MIYIESKSTDPYFNLALEEYVFEQMNKEQDVFMLWQNENTIVVGKNQNTLEEINQEAVKRQDIHVVRRLSGGGAVYHDSGNLNFTFIVDSRHGESFNFQMFALPVVKALKKFGVRAEFNGRNDITIDGLKFSGNSQYMKHGRLLHHGCIMLDSNLEKVADALKVKISKFESKGIKSVRSRVTTINAHTERHISMEEFKKALKEAAFENEELVLYELTEEDLDVVERLRSSKYTAWEWNYGRSPDYGVRQEKKFPGGLITAYLLVSKGKIKSVRFYGDFFGNGDLKELERAMEGFPLNEDLLAELDRLDIGYYMNGISSGELFRLLLGYETI